MRSSMKIESPQNGEITLSFTDILVGKSLPSREFSMSQICLLMLFVIIMFSRKFEFTVIILFLDNLCLSSLPVTIIAFILLSVTDNCLTLISSREI